MDPKLNRRRPLARAAVGGVEHVVGGWGAYEIARRRACWRESRDPPSARYPGRTYVTAGDAVESVLAGARVALGGGAEARGRGPSALRKAALQLADSLARLEDRLCDPDDEGVWECLSPARGSARVLGIPPITSDDLRAFAEDPAQEADPEALYELGEDVGILAATVGVSFPPVEMPGLPPLPARVVPVTDEEGILRLEAAATPRIASLEEFQAALAERLGTTADAVGRAAV